MVCRANRQDRARVDGRYPRPADLRDRRSRHCAMHKGGWLTASAQGDICALHAAARRRTIESTQRACSRAVHVSRLAPGLNDRRCQYPPRHRRRPPAVPRRVAAARLASVVALGRRSSEAGSFDESDRDGWSGIATSISMLLDLAMPGDLAASPA